MFFVEEKPMPIFEFKCLECNIVFEELLVKSNDKNEISCPECKSHSFERVVSKTSYTMGINPEKKQPNITTKSCGPTSQCMTLNLPGHEK